ncbi:MAG: site-specific tyrosine recombinase/integron integrase [Candidatus Paceibacterota bacterium]
MTEIQSLKTKFLEYLEIEKGRSLKTVENYDRYLNRFFNQAKIKQAEDITDEAVREFRLWLNRQPGTLGAETMKKSTQNYYLIALRSFLKYLAKQKITSLSPERIELAKTPGRQLDLISEEELNRLLEAPVGQTEKVLRDKAILELLFSTGLRVSELCSLNIDTVDLKQDEFSIRGKGEKVRLVFLSTEAKTSLIAYLQARKDMEEPLFVGQDRSGQPRRLTPRSIERIVKHYAIVAGISRKVTPHIIRHSFATDLLRGGADIRSVQLMLGHANVATTQVYTHVTDRQLKEMHRHFHGKSRH